MLVRPRRRNNAVADLHAALQQRPLPPFNTIQDLIKTHPNAASVRGPDGWLPLHRATRRDPTVALLRVLIEAYPDAIREWTADGLPELGARLPIHLLCQYGACLEAVKFVAGLQPETLTARCLDHGLTPLQYALKCWEAHIEDPLPQTLAVVEWLESSIPEPMRPPHPTRPIELSILRSSTNMSSAIDEKRDIDEDVPQQFHEPQDEPQNEPQQDNDTPAEEQLSQQEQHPTAPQSTGSASQSSSPPHETPKMGLRPFRRNNNGVAEFHAAFQKQSLPLSNTVQRMLKIHRNAASVRGLDGWLPLHHAACRDPTVPLLKVLIDAHPKAILEWTPEEDTNIGARLPIHLLCQHGASLEAVKFIAGLQPETVSVRCLNHGFTPLQYAMKCCEAHVEEPLPQTLAVVKWLKSSMPPPVPPPRPRELSESSVLRNSMNSSIGTNERQGSHEDMHPQVHEPQDVPQQHQETPVVKQVFQRERQQTVSQPTGAVSESPLSFHNLNPGQCYSFHLRRESSTSTEDTIRQETLSNTSESNSHTGNLSAPKYASTASLRRAIVSPKRTTYVSLLHDACATKHPSLEYVQELIQACPKSVRVASKLYGFIALHHACVWSASLPVVECLVQAWPESVKKTKDDGMLPLHCACSAAAATTATDRDTRAAWTSIIQRLVQYYPRAVLHCTKQGKTPLDLLLSKLPSISASQPGIQGKNTEVDKKAVKILEEMQTRLRSPHDQELSRSRT